jgi:hypothetical protein
VLTALPAAQGLTGTLAGGAWLGSRLSPYTNVRNFFCLPCLSLPNTYCWQHETWRGPRQRHAAGIQSLRGGCRTQAKLWTGRTRSMDKDLSCERKKFLVVAWPCLSLPSTYC